MSIAVSTLMNISKYTLVKEKKNEVNCWGRYLTSMQMLMICTMKEQMYTFSFSFIDLYSKQIMTSLFSNHKIEIYSKIIELKNFKLLVEDDDFFFVLNLRNFQIEQTVSYIITEREQGVCLNIPFLIKKDLAHQQEIDVIKENFGIIGYKVIDIDKEQVIVLKLKMGYICNVFNNNTIYYFDHLRQFLELTNHCHYQNY